MALIEELRFSLPADKLAHILTVGALTGKLPVMDKQGQYTGEDQDLIATQRVDLAKYVLNKTMPDRAPTTEQLGRDEKTNAADVTADSVEDMTDDQIRNFLRTDLEAAELESVTDSEG